ncbi:MAG: hypothetical protein MZV70_17265 [Desulfobacterales bacterium]|nr:hypothetical protein [Desulfobacterales bacterium]
MGFLGLAIPRPCCPTTALGAYRLEGHPGRRPRRVRRRAVDGAGLDRRHRAGAEPGRAVAGPVHRGHPDRVRLRQARDLLRRSGVPEPARHWRAAWAARPAWPRRRDAEPEIEDEPEIDETPKQRAAPRQAGARRQGDRGRRGRHRGRGRCEGRRGRGRRRRSHRRAGRGAGPAPRRAARRGARPGARGGRGKAKEAAGTAVVLGAAAEQDSGGVVVAPADSGDTMRTELGQVIEMEAELPPRIRLATPPIEPPPARGPSRSSSSRSSARRRPRRSTRPSPPPRSSSSSATASSSRPGPELLDYQEPENLEFSTRPP